MVLWLDWWGTFLVQFVIYQIYQPKEVVFLGSNLLEEEKTEIEETLGIQYDKSRSFHLLWNHPNINEFSSINVLKPKTPFHYYHPQTVNGHTLFKKRLQVNEGVEFADGTALTTSGESNSYIIGVGKTCGSISDRLRVYTSDNKVIVWGGDGWGGVGSPNSPDQGMLNNSKNVWPPRVVPFKDNYNLKIFIQIYFLFKIYAVNLCKHNKITLLPLSISHQM